MWLCNQCAICNKEHRCRARDRGRRKVGPGKEKPRTADAAAIPAIFAPAVVMLEEENKWRVGELLTAYGVIATKTMTTRPLQQ
jgi:hypothetical protein